MTTMFGIFVTIARDRLFAIIVFTSELLTKVEYNKVVRQPHKRTLCVVWYHMHPCVVRSYLHARLYIKRTHSLE